MHIDDLIAVLDPHDEIIFQIEDRAAGKVREVRCSYDAAIEEIRNLAAKHGNEEFLEPHFFKRSDGQRVVRFGPGIGGFSALVRREGDGTWKGRSVQLEVPFDYVLDTNVFIDITNVRAFLDAIAESESEQWQTDPKVVYRAQRASDALALACLFHEYGNRTYSLPESARVTFKLSPPEDPSHSIFPALFYNFVHEQVLNGWVLGMDPQAIKTDFATGIDAGLRGEECDDLLVEIADFNNLPFITCEGITPTGIVDKGVRAKAKARGVQVFAPLELIQSRGFDAERAIRDFVARFNAKAPAYVEKFGEKKQTAGNNLSQLAIYYTEILKFWAR